MHAISLSKLRKLLDAAQEHFDNSQHIEVLLSGSLKLINLDAGKQMELVLSDKCLLDIDTPMSFKGSL